MSAFIPFEIQTEIIKRLPAKSAVKFRLVSKRWNSYIGSYEFIITHHRHRQQPHRLLAWCKGPPKSLHVAPNHSVSIFDDKYITIFDDVDTFYQQDFTPKAPRLSKVLTNSRVVDCCLGLVCLYDYVHPDFIAYKSKVVIIWNPLIGKSVSVPLPDSPNTQVIGFGVCPVTFNPTVVKISCGYLTTSIPWEVQVFTLSSGTWKSLLSSILPRKTVSLPHKTVDLQFWYQCSQVLIDRFIYWDACETRIVADNAEPQKVNLIVSFDMVTHEFELIDLPDSLSHPFYMNLSKIRESLSVVEYIRDDHMNDICAVWVMEDIVTKSFTKLYNVKAPNLLSKTVLSFRKNGEPIMETHNDGEQTAILEVYEPCSEHTSKLGISGHRCSFFVSSYVETLLLLDQEDCHIVADSN